MRLLFFLILFSVCINCLSAEPNYHSNRCHDLSGRFAFWGEWKQYESKGEDPESTSEVKAANMNPRFDRFALSIGTNQIIEPSVIILQQNMETGTLLVNVIGKGVYKNAESFSLKLPAEVSLKCIDGAWERETKSEGGGENVRSTVLTNIQLNIEASGDVLARGKEEITKGWIFKQKISVNWVARFKRLVN